MNDRTDVVIGERRLLSYILQQQFDQELLNIQANGIYQQILNQWP